MTVTADRTATGASAGEISFGANMTTIIDNLEKRGIVERTRSGDDRRQIMITLTPQGKKLIEDLFPLHLQNIFRMMSVLSADELELYARLSRKLGLGAREKMSI